MELRSITAHIKRLELKLLTTDWQADPALINELLSGDFEEISSNGQIGTRDDIINWLLNKDNCIQWSLVDFRIKVLADDLVLAIYVARKLNDTNNVSSGSVRTSVWKYQGGHWKMLFHQASKINNSY